MRALPDRQRQYSALPLLQHYQQPEKPLRAEALGSTERFPLRGAGGEIGPDKDIPHVTAPIVVKCITSLKLMGLHNAQKGEVTSSGVEDARLVRSFFTGIKVVLGGVDAPTLPARPALGPAAPAHAAAPSLARAPDRGAPVVLEGAGHRRVDEVRHGSGDPVVSEAAAQLHLCRRGSARQALAERNDEVD